MSAKVILATWLGGLNTSKELMPKKEDQLKVIYPFCKEIFNFIDSLVLNTSLFDFM